MGVDHRRTNVRVPQQRLDRAEVVARLKQVRGIRMAESMRRHALCELRLSYRLVQRILNMRIMQMIPSPLLRGRNEGK